MVIVDVTSCSMSLGQGVVAVFGRAALVVEYYRAVVMSVRKYQLRATEMERPQVRSLQDVKVRSSYALKWPTCRHCGILVAVF